MKMELNIIVFYHSRENAAFGKMLAPHSQHKLAADAYFISQISRLSM
jgi:hypothetical protein